MITEKTDNKTYPIVDISEPEVSMFVDYKYADCWVTVGFKNDKPVRFTVRWGHWLEDDMKNFALDSMDGIDLQLSDKNIVSLLKTMDLIKENNPTKKLL